MGQACLSYERTVKRVATQTDLDQQENSEEMLQPAKMQIYQLLPKLMLKEQRNDHENKQQTTTLNTDHLDTTLQQNNLFVPQSLISELILDAHLQRDASFSFQSGQDDASKKAIKGILKTKKSQAKEKQVKWDRNYKSKSHEELNLSQLLKRRKQR